jgi:aromatic ring-opening dioxygenase catalytic subunit (LigB family)
MSVEFACSMAHAPGIVAWPDAAPAVQKRRIYETFDELRRRLAEARLDVLVLFTAEHWANFFLDHMSAFCIGSADAFTGPIESWLKIDKRVIRGDPQLARALLEACYANDLEPSSAQELQLDHGTMIPLHFLTPDMQVPVVPILINTLAPRFHPHGAAWHSAALWETSRGARESASGLVATGGMSHDPGERNHGVIDSAFDQRFLEQMTRGDLSELASYSQDDLLRAGAGAVELLCWIALAGALRDFHGEVLAYEPVKPWATGVGAMVFYST